MQDPFNTQPEDLTEEEVKQLEELRRNGGAWPDTRQQKQKPEQPD
jgi:hypothetical protein